MKVNKKHNGWIIGLVCVFIFMAMMLCACGGEPDATTETTEQTESTAGQTETTETTEGTKETTEATEETTEPTEENTEPTEESTEETTEPTEATTFPTAPPTSNAIGSPGSLGIPTEPTEETTEPTEPTEPVIVPAGEDSNPYCEVIREYPAGFESVSVPGKSLTAYAVFVNNGAELTIESPDAYVIHEGKTYEAVDGVVKLLLTAPKNGPALFHLGNTAPGEKMFQLSIVDALGEPTNPQILEQIDEVKVTLEEDDQTGYSFQWTAQEEGTVTFQVAEITENVECDVILTVGEMTVHLVAPESEEIPGETEPEETEAEGSEAEALTAEEAPSEEEPSEEQPSEEQPAEPETEEPAGVSIGVNAEDVLTIQVITLLPEKEEEAVTEADGEASTEPTEPEEAEEEKLPAAEITLKGAFEAGVNPDQEEQNKPTEETEPSESTEPTEETEPSESTEPTEETEPSESTEPTEETEPSESTEPTEETEPSESTEPTEETEPSESTEPTEETEPSESTEPTDATEGTEATEPSEPVEEVPGYSVTVTDYNGNPKTGVVVQILKDGTAVAMLPVDDSGVAAAAELEEGTYTVKLLFSGEELYYEEKNAVLTGDASHITLKVAPKMSGDSETINNANAYIVDVGGTYVKTQADIVNYFIFSPTVAGNYMVTTSDPDAVISYWGGNTFFLPSVPYEMEMTGNAYYLNVKESNLGEEQGVAHIIGITGAEDCILEIIRVGDPILGDEDMPYTEYEGTRAVTPYTYTGSGSTKNYIDILSKDKPTLVLNPEDGYYHLDSADGVLVYMDLTASAPYIPLYGIMGMGAVGGENVARYIYDDEGNLIAKERYNVLLQEYAKNADETHGIYPLTEDLAYMIQQGGNRKGWWDPESPNYLFTDYPNVNTEIAWMFGLCTMD